MATCKDCIHCAACDEMYMQLTSDSMDGIEYIEGAEDCPHFESCSEHKRQIHAHWIIDKGGVWAECSNCHEDEKIAVLAHKDFCPACGAIMDEESVVIVCDD